MTDLENPVLRGYQAARWLRQVLLVRGSLCCLQVQVGPVVLSNPVGLEARRVLVSRHLLLLPVDPDPRVLQAHLGIQVLQ